MAESTTSSVIDPQAQVDAVRRHVKNNASTHVVVLQRTYTNRAEEVWAAVTDPEHLADWFIRPEGDLRTGGHYRLPAMGVEGTLEYIDHVRALQMSWESNAEQSLLAVAVTQGEAGTTVTLRHTLADNEHWKTYGPAATGIGWDGALAALDLHLSGNEGRTRSLLEDFDGSAAAQDLMRASAQAWKEAQVASDVAEDVAEQAARRALEFYGASARPLDPAGEQNREAASAGAGHADAAAAPNAEPAPGHEPGAPEQDGSEQAGPAQAASAQDGRSQGTRTGSSSPA